MPDDEKTKILRELLVWTRIGFYSTVKDMLIDVLDTDNKRVAYQLTDGTMTKDTIRARAQIGSTTLNDLYKQCINLGLMESLDDGPRHRLFDLTSFGLMPASVITKLNIVAGGNGYEG
jgi:hypothetical protein